MSSQSVSRRQELWREFFFSSASISASHRFSNSSKCCSTVLTHSSRACLTVSLKLLFLILIASNSRFCIVTQIPVALYPEQWSESGSARAHAAAQRQCEYSSTWAACASADAPGCARRRMSDTVVCGRILHKPEVTVSAEIVDGLPQVQAAIHPIEVSRLAEICHVEAFIMEGNIIMEPTSKPILLQVNEQKVHANNTNLHRKVTKTGIIGTLQSELINKLNKQLHEQQENQHKPIHTTTPSPQHKQLMLKLEQLEREEGNLKRQMTRMSEIAKNNKNSKIAIEIKYESLLKQFSRCRARVQELQEKVSVLNELNGCLFKLTQNVLKVMPQYQNNCNSLLAFIDTVRAQVDPENRQDSPAATSSALNQLQKRLDQFKSEVDFMQNYQKKLISNLTEAHLQTKTISERFSIMASINRDDVNFFKKEISEITEFLQPDPSDSFSETGSLVLCSDVVSLAYYPETSRLSKVFKDLSMLFEQHIHLLETQKMEFQFTKNKKLIACQKFECQICESYEKIVSQIFSIVREAFKQIKFQFLREIKPIADISEIPILL